MLATKPDLIPGSLTTVLGCATTTDPVVKNLCVKAENFGGKYLDVYALAQSAGQLTNFGLFTWTQRVKFQLINPLLGNNCYIGSDNNPVVLNPQLSIAPGGRSSVIYRPEPGQAPGHRGPRPHGADATDTIFTAPGVTGCGPGGAANISVDEALDAGTGLPAASGVNSLTLNGNFYVAATDPAAGHVADPAAEQRQDPAVRVQGQRRDPRWAPGSRPPALRRRGCAVCSGISVSAAGNRSK